MRKRIVKKSISVFLALLVIISAIACAGDVLSTFAEGFPALNGNYAYVQNAILTLGADGDLTDTSGNFVQADGSTILSIDSCGDGTAEFDEDDDPGHDSSAHNLICRTFDTITYYLSVYVNTNEYGTEGAHQLFSEAKYNVELLLPVTKDIAVFDVSQYSQMNYTYDPDTMYERTYQIPDPNNPGQYITETKECQILTYEGRKVNSDGSQAFPGLFGENVTVKVQGAHNGDKVRAIANIAMEYNDWDTQKYTAVGQEVTISARLSVNAILTTYQGTADTVRDSWDFGYTGNGSADDIYNYPVNDYVSDRATSTIFGRRSTWGVGLCVYNPDSTTNKKGLEMPSGDITIKITPQTILNNGLKPATLTDITSNYMPLLWTGAGNGEYYNSYVRSEKGRKISTSLPALPYNTETHKTYHKTYGTYLKDTTISTSLGYRIACYDGGTWLCSQESDGTITIVVKDYKVNQDYFPTAQCNIQSKKLDARTYLRNDINLNSRPRFGVMDEGMGFFSTGVLSIVTPYDNISNASHVLATPFDIGTENNMQVDSENLQKIETKLTITSVTSTETDSGDTQILDCQSVDASKYQTVYNDWIDDNTCTVSSSIYLAGNFQQRVMYTTPYYTNPTDTLTSSTNFWSEPLDTEGYKLPSLAVDDPGLDRAMPNQRISLYTVINCEQNSDELNNPLALIQFTKFNSDFVQLCNEKVQYHEYEKNGITGLVKTKKFYVATLPRGDTALGNDELLNSDEYSLEGGKFKFYLIQTDTEFDDTVLDSIPDDEVVTGWLFAGYGLVTTNNVANANNLMNIAWPAQIVNDDSLLEKTAALTTSTYGFRAIHKRDSNIDVESILSNWDTTDTSNPNANYFPDTSIFEFDTNKMSYKKSEQSDALNINGYVKTSYGSDFSILNTHQSGQYGDTVLIAAEAAKIKKSLMQQISIGTDLETKTAYSLSNGQFYVDYKLEPSIACNVEATDVDYYVDVTIQDTLPIGLTYVEGSAYQGGIYKQSDLPDVAEGEPNPTNVYGGQQCVIINGTLFEPEISTDEDGRQVLTWHINHIKMHDTIEPIYYTAYIGESDMPNAGAELQNIVHITSTHDKRPAQYSLGNADYKTIKILTASAISYAKTAEKTEVTFENNQYTPTELSYNIRYSNYGGTRVEHMRIIDVLPFNGDSRGSDYTGFYLTEYISFEENFKKYPNILDELSFYYIQRSDYKLIENYQSYINAYASETGITVDEDTCIDKYYEIFGDYWNDVTTGNKQITYNTITGIDSSDAWNLGEFTEEGLADFSDIDISSDNLVAWAIVGNMNAYTVLSCQTNLLPYPTDLTQTNKYTNCGVFGTSTPSEPAPVKVYSASIKGLVWNDFDKNGTREDNEQKLAGVKVNLLKLRTGGNPNNIEDYEPVYSIEPDRTNWSNEDILQWTLGTNEEKEALLTKYGFTSKQISTTTGHTIDIITGKEVSNPETNTIEGKTIPNEDYYKYVFSGVSSNTVYAVQFEDGTIQTINHYTATSENKGDDTIDSDAHPTYENSRLKDAVILNIATPDTSVYQNEKYESDNNDLGLYDSFNFEFTKISGKHTDEPLAGAKFKLYKYNHDVSDSDYAALSSALLSNPVYNAEDWNLASEDTLLSTSDSDGKVSFENLTSGLYLLVETEAPDGYELSKGCWIIKVDGSNANPISITGCSSSDNEDDMPNAFLTETNEGKIEYYLPNYQKTILPVSGSDGIGYLLIAGTSFMVTACAFMFYSIKKKKYVFE